MTTLTISNSVLEQFVVFKSEGRKNGKPFDHYKVIRKYCLTDPFYRSYWFNDYPVRGTSIPLTLDLIDSIDLDDLDWNDGSHELKMFLIQKRDSNK